MIKKQKHFHNVKKSFSKKKTYVNKFKQFLDNPLKIVNNKSKQVSDNLKKITKSLGFNSVLDLKVKKLINNVFYNNNVNSYAIIILMMTAIFLKNKEVFKSLLTAYQHSKWSNFDFLYQINKAMFDKGGIEGLAQVFALMSIFAHDIPAIFLFDQSNYKDLDLIYLIKKITGNIAETKKELIVKPKEENDRKIRNEEDKEDSNALKTAVEELIPKISELNATIGIERNTFSKTKNGTRIERMAPFNKDIADKILNSSPSPKPTYSPKSSPKSSP